MNSSIDNIFLRLLVSSKIQARTFRHMLLWTTTVGLIFIGFWFMSQKIASPSFESKLYYSVASTLFFGAMTVAAYLFITKVTHLYILKSFKAGRFFMLMVAVHVLSTFFVMLYFQLFIQAFSLKNLPVSYQYYGEHIDSVPLYLVPVDGVIVWLFSFSLYYNYLLYAVGLKVFKDLFAMKIDKTELEQENLKLEYSFLKAQVNPHFLFNTLNNIYSFSVISPSKVGEMILKLADLMRYSLYETNEEFVSLHKELQFLESYMTLQRVRHEQNAEIIYKLQGEPGNQKITPMLLVTFLENAFKHGLQSQVGTNWMSVSLEIQDNVLMFNIANNTSDIPERTEGGLGLKNVKKRLDHYYPKRYHLTIDHSRSTYSVQLTLSLNGEHLQSIDH